MALMAAVLSVLLATQGQVPKTDPRLQRDITTFVGHLKAERLPEAYSLLSTAAKKAVGPAQFAAYVGSRRRVLGGIVEVTSVRVSDVMEAEHGMTIYEADVRFEKGTSPSWFVMAREDAGWRIQTYGLNMPEGTEAAYVPGEALPIAKEMLDFMKSDGAVALADRFSEKDLAEVEQTPETARAGFAMLHALLGPLQSYTLGTPADDDERKCRTVRGEGKFQHGAAPLTVRLCWSDGVWRLRHAEITPQMDPAMLERSIAHALQGKVTAKCPRDAAFRRHDRLPPHPPRRAPTGRHHPPHHGYRLEDHRPGTGEVTRAPPPRGNGRGRPRKIEGEPIRRCRSQARSSRPCGAAIRAREPSNGVAGEGSKRPRRNGAPRARYDSGSSFGSLDAARLSMVSPIRTVDPGIVIMDPMIVTMVPVIVTMVPVIATMVPVIVTMVPVIVIIGAACRHHGSGCRNHGAGDRNHGGRGPVQVAGVSYRRRLAS